MNCLTLHVGYQLVVLGTKYAYLIYALNEMAPKYTLKEDDFRHKDNVLSA